MRRRGRRDLSRLVARYRSAIVAPSAISASWARTAAACLRQRARERNGPLAPPRLLAPTGCQPVEIFALDTYISIQRAAPALNSPQRRPPTGDCRSLSPLHLPT